MTWLKRKPAVDTRPDLLGSAQMFFAGALVALGCTPDEAATGWARAAPRPWSPDPEDQAALLLSIRDELLAARSE